MKGSFAQFVVLLVLLLGVGITACQSVDSSEKLSQGSLFVRTATVQVLDQDTDQSLCGHRVAILLGDGSYILPTNLNSFLDKPFHNQKVQITYRSEDSKTSGCSEAKSVYLSHVDINIDNLTGLE